MMPGVIVPTQAALKSFFLEEVILLGWVVSNHKNKEDLIFKLARMLDWIYRRHTGQIGDFENNTIEWLLNQSYKPHLSTIYLLEKHFPEARRSNHETTEEVDQASRLIQQARG